MSIVEIRSAIGLIHLLFFISCAIATTSCQSPVDNFIQCFSHHVPPTNINVYAQGTNSYTTLLLSSIHNQRFVNSTTKPLLIVTATDQAHVQAAVICGKRHAIRLRVRSGGHDYEGLSYRSTVQELFIVLDLNRLRSIKIDTLHREAWVESGATVGELYYAISKASPTLAFPAGFCPSMGIGGHISGGGFGNLLRKYGLSSDHILDCLLVDANGRILDRESMGEDLFWAVQGGGGGSFGVILSFKIELVEVPPKVTVFSVSKRRSEDAIKLLDRWQRAAYRLPNDLYIEAVVQTVDSPLLTTNRTVGVTFRSLYLGEKEELVEIMNEEFPELGVRVEHCTEMSWAESTLVYAGYSNLTLDQFLDRTYQRNINFKGKYDFVTEPIHQTEWEQIWERFRDGSGTRLMEIDPYGGKMNEIPETTTPFPHRMGIIFKILYMVTWKEGGEKAIKRHDDWMRKFHKSMTPYVSTNPRGAYVNIKDLDMGRNEEVGKTCYFNARIWGERYFKRNFERLAVVKRNVDPDNYFWNEQSIPLLL